MRPENNLVFVDSFQFVFDDLGETEQIKREPGFVYFVISEQNSSCAEMDFMKWSSLFIYLFVH